VTVSEGYRENTKAWIPFWRYVVPTLIAAVMLVCMVCRYSEERERWSVCEPGIGNLDDAALRLACRWLLDEV